MREILFKAKRLDNNEWVYGYLVKHPSAIQIGETSPWYIHVPPAHPEDNGGVYNVDPETVCQYTGLIDKNGNKIFEGDVVSYEYTVGSDKMCHKYEVTWEGAGFSIFFDNDGFNSKEVAVIGNIYDKQENK